LEEQPPEGWRGMNTLQFWTMIVVGFSVLFVVAGLSAPMILRSRKASDRTYAINNAKQVGLALLEFDREFGSFPNAKTAALVKSQTRTGIDLSGTSSNAMFRQLIAFGIQSEDIFYCLHPEGIRKPDRVMTPGRALQAREVGFSYIAGLDSSMNPGIPVLLTPMKIGTEEFWGDVHGHKAVILRLDNSVEAPLIRSKDDKVSVGGGKTLFDTGPMSVWPAGHVIDLRHPEK
jgi:hypothetical protein